MAAAPVDATVDQPGASRALFLKAIGAVLPNARIDFVDMPHNQKTGLPGNTDAVTSDCSTDGATGSLVSQSPQTEPQETDVLLDNTNSDNGSGPAGSLPAGSPAPGTPEWTPRGAHTEQTSQVHCDASSRQSHYFRTQVLETVGSELAPQVHLAQTPQMLSPAFLGDASGRRPVQLGPQVPQLVGSEHGSHSHLSQPPQIVSPPMWCGGVEAHSWYRVAYLGGINLRAQPSVLAAHTGVTLSQNDVFAVSAEIAASDGRIYLRLADGRGWAFDDSALVPHDPSVVREPVLPPLPHPPPPWDQVTNGCAPPLEQVASDCSPAWPSHVVSGYAPAYSAPIDWAQTVWMREYN